MWQSDFIHWRLADETDVEILNWLDDHSRLLLSCSAHGPVTGDVVVSVSLELVEEYGPPASTLTDNGSVYTSRFTGGRNAFEYLLPILGVRQRTAPPAIPKHKARPSGPTRPCSASYAPKHPRAASRSCSASSTSSVSITTSSARTARSGAAHRPLPTTRPQSPTGRISASRARSPSL
jgi:hypothetical protein